MILFCGRIEPGSGCGAVFTGQSLLANPALTAATSARLSFLVRPLIVGTASGGAFGGQAFPLIPAGARREGGDVGGGPTQQGGGGGEKERGAAHTRPGGA